MGWLAPIGASAFVFVFALFRATDSSMWWDEAFSFAAAKQPLSSLLDLIWVHEANMGPYYLVLWGWIRIDDGDLWIKLLSALATITALWGVWVIVRRWSGTGLAALAVTVFALTQYVLVWSIQARGYAMAMAATAWSLVFADRIRTGEGRWSGMVFGALVGLAVALQLSTAFVFVGVVAGISMLAPTRATLRSLVVGGAVAGVVIAPFSAAVIRNPDQAEWIPALTLDSFRAEFMRAASGPWWALVIGSGWICLAVGAAREARVRPYLLALAGAVSGVVGLVATSLLVRPMFISRYLIGCVPLAVVAAIGGASVLWPRRWRALTIAVVALSLVALGTSVGRIRFGEDYRSAAAVVLDDLRDTDAIVPFGGFSLIGLTRYLPEGTPTHRIVPSAEIVGDWSVVAPDSSSMAADRLWVIVLEKYPPPEFAEWVSTDFPYVVIDRPLGEVRLVLRQRAPD